jgi:hypothetical protein
MVRSLVDGIMTTDPTASPDLVGTTVDGDQRGRVRNGRGPRIRGTAAGVSRYCWVPLDVLGDALSVIDTLGETLPLSASLGETLSLGGSLFDGDGDGDGDGESFVGVGDGLCEVGPGPGVGRWVGLRVGFVDGVARPVPVGVGPPVVLADAEADGDLDRLLGDALLGAGLSVSATVPGVALDSAAGGRLGGA